MISRKARAFTLIELLVVVSIISILIVLLLPVVQQASDGARKSHRKNSLSQFGVGLHNYYQASGISRIAPQKPLANSVGYPNTLNTAGWMLSQPE